MSCGAAPVTGGRRMRGGMGYGFGGPMGTNGPVWNAAWGGEVTKSGEPVTGGRRRRSRKGGKKRRSTRRRGGADEDDMPPAFPSGPSAPGSMEAFPGLSAPPTGPSLPVVGAPLSAIPEATSSQEEEKGGRKKSRKGGRKSRKGTKKSRKVRKMRGGGSVGLVGASFTGSGSRGIADYEPYPSNVPVGGAFAIPTGTR
jgi:hypothetical protein